MGVSQMEKEMNMNVQVPVSKGGRSKVRYSREKAPSSLKEAEFHLDDLNKTILTIEGRLQYKDLEEFETDEDYADWKGRASYALSMMKAEKLFLEEWIGDARRDRDRKAEAVRREAERAQLAEEQQKRSQQNPEGVMAGIDFVGTLVNIAREAYRSGVMSPQNRAFFEATFSAVR